MQVSDHPAVLTEYETSEPIVELWDRLVFFLISNTV